MYFETIKEDTNIHNCVEQYVYKFEFHLKLIPSYSRKKYFSICTRRAVATEIESSL